MDVMGGEAGGGFLFELVRQFQATADGAGEAGGRDFQLLEPLLARTHRRSGVTTGAPDPDVFWRIELFHAAVAVAIERRTGVAC